PVIENPKFDYAKIEFVSPLAPSSRMSTEEARGSSSPLDPTMSNKHGCSGRNLKSDLHKLLCLIFTYKKGRLHLTKIILPAPNISKTSSSSISSLKLSCSLIWRPVFPLWWCYFSRNVKGGDELMGVDKLLLDSKQPSYRHRLTAYRHHFKADTVLPIPKERFKFHNHSEVLWLANRNTHLPDLICELTAVKSIVSDPTQGKHRVMTGGSSCSHDVSLTLSLFHSQLSSCIVSQPPGRLLC
ncbi:LOW QUALITY PROTEIN: hypothetical protein HID58_008871, partial [Brassica napus]